MAYYAVYHTKDRTLFSTGSSVANPLPDGFAVIETTEEDVRTKQWDPETLTFVPRPPATIRSFSPWGFRRRFTFDERVAIDSAALTNPIVRTILEDMRSAGSVELDDPDLRQGLGGLVALGLLAQERMAVLLTPDVVRE
jgi:hypothetical protein